ncbi:MAG: hypothetical protein K2W97_07025 [Chthoniobacterales bacterium]|nr:hypothetical protein [Chthoniobacterales bacterium]
MNFHQRENGDMEVSEIDPLLAFLMVEGIRQEEEEWDCIAESFLATPLAEDALFSQDWKEYVQPGLLTLFKSCHAHVITDLENMKREQLHGSQDRLATLLIPAAHREAWLRILNVARLSLAARHRLHDQEISGEVVPDLNTERGKALLQLQLFSMIQQVLVEVEMQ